MIPAAGQYWKLIGEDDPIPTGDLVLVVGFEEGKILFAWGDEEYSVEPDEFFASYQFEPRGEDALQERIREVIQQAELETQKEVKLLGEVEQSGVTDLATLSPQSADQAKRMVADARNKITKVRNQMLRAQVMVEKRARQLEAMARVQERQLAKMTEALEGKLELAREAIWTVNLYLGKDEEIKRLSEGHPASIETPVTVRQRRLFMDEECALAAESGGLTAIEFAEFDEWLLKPENQNRVLPEPRGVVVFRPRRKIKPTGDQWHDQAQARRDYKTYFLFRNGENLFRVCTDLEVDSTLFPKRDELDEFFTKTRFNHKTREYDEVVIKPGSEEYMEKMKAADGQGRHYMRVLLFLQGILDRTTIFQPLPGGHVNLLDPRDDTLIFLRDAEDVIADGRPRFSEWLRDLNAKLQPGHRIMGVFRSYGSYSSQGEGSRIWPENCLDHPDDLDIYTLEAVEGDKRWLKFKFTRTCEISTYDRWGSYDGYRLPKTRASFRVQRSDDFILNIDDASVEDVEFYLTSFADRVHYIHLFPLLKKALEVKRAEAAGEEPFRQLLLGQLAREHQVMIDSRLGGEVDELIGWWKLKNRVHRALKEDDAKALRMIVKEYGRRLRLERERGDEDVIQKARAQLTDLHSGALFIGHVREREFVVLESMSDGNEFTRRLDYRYSTRSGKVKLTAEREWWLVTRTWKRWMELRSTDRWSKWEFDVDPTKALTDPEIHELARWGVGELRRLYKAHGRGTRFLPMFVTWDSESHQLEVWWGGDAPDLRGDNLLSGRLSRSDLTCSAVTWERRGSEIVSRYVSVYGTTYRVPHDPVRGRWVVWEEKHNQEKFQREWERIKELEMKERTLRELDRKASSSLKEQCQVEWERQKRVEFDVDYGDPELWEAHLKSLEKPHFAFDLTDHCLTLLIERGIEVNGRTVAEIREAAKSLLSSRRKRWGSHWNEVVDDHKLEDSSWLLPTFVVEVTPDEEEEEDDDEDHGVGSVFVSPHMRGRFGDEDEDDD